MSRPLRTTIASGTQAWDGRMDDNLIKVFDQPIPVHEHTGDETDLEATFPAAAYDRCAVWVDHTTEGFTLYVSDGTNWQPRDGGKQVVETVTGASTLGVEAQVVLQGGSLPYTTELPTAASMRGRTVTFKQTGAGTWTVDGNGAEQIDGGASITLTAAQQARQLFSDGTSWHVIASV